MVKVEMPIKIFPAVSMARTITSVIRYQDKMLLHPFFEIVLNIS
jgi:hypothetical protein